MQQAQTTQPIRTVLHDPADLHPYKFHTTTNGYVDYSDTLYSTEGKNLTVAEFIAQHNPALVEVGSEEYGVIMGEKSRKKYLTGPELIDSDRFFEMLEVLPPCAWKRDVVETFYISEAQIDNIHTAFGHYGDLYIEKNIDICDPSTFIKVEDFDIAQQAAEATTQA